jgi:hypothetical protein
VYLTVVFVVDTNSHVEYSVNDGRAERKDEVTWIGADAWGKKLS